MGLICLHQLGSRIAYTKDVDRQGKIRRENFDDSHVGTSNFRGVSTG